MNFIDLSQQQVSQLEEALERDDQKHIPVNIPGSVSIGLEQEGQLIAGADGCMTAFHIFYLSTLFVLESYRGQGIGRALMKEVEERAKKLGAKMIRLDTFNWQGKDFYKALGYEEVGRYESKEENFSEYFFLKRI